jgi:hypothetical protein
LEFFAFVNQISAKQQYILQVSLEATKDFAEKSQKALISVFGNLTNGDTGHETITALNPIARRALISFHGHGLMNSLGLVAEIVLKNRLCEHHQG